mmetsp:Transcript_13240/g.40952  ORF Transcript_13240/g.40952 Transcript_13240/m.40952 type:complete len:412 (-) Transcript_13240:270-1505(-)
MMNPPKEPARRTLSPTSWTPSSKRETPRWPASAAEDAAGPEGGEKEKARARTGERVAARAGRKTWRRTPRTREMPGTQRRLRRTRQVPGSGARWQRTGARVLQTGPKTTRSRSRAARSGTSPTVALTVVTRPRSAARRTRPRRSVARRVGAVAGGTAAGVQATTGGGTTRGTGRTGSPLGTSRTGTRSRGGTHHRPGRAGEARTGVRLTRAPSRAETGKRMGRTGPPSAAPTAARAGVRRGRVPRRQCTKLRRPGTLPQSCPSLRHPLQCRPLPESPPRRRCLRRLAWAARLWGSCPRAKARGRARAQGRGRRRAAGAGLPPARAPSPQPLPGGCPTQALREGAATRHRRPGQHPEARQLPRRASAPECRGRHRCLHPLASQPLRQRQLLPTYRPRRRRLLRLRGALTQEW